MYNLEYWKTALKGVVPKELVTHEVVALREQQDKMLNLMAKKNADYGNAFNNGCDDLGMFYGLARIYDKAKRVIKLTSDVANGHAKPNVVDETLYDTIQDLANYCNMILAWANDQAKDIEMQTSSTGAVEQSEVYTDLYQIITNGTSILVTEKTFKNVTDEVKNQYGFDNLCRDNASYVYNQNKDNSYVAVTVNKELVRCISKSFYEEQNKVSVEFE